MSDQKNAAATEQVDSAKANWDALREPVAVQTESKTQTQNTDIQEDAKVAEEKPAEATAGENKETAAQPTETKEKTKETTAGADKGYAAEITTLELKPEDVDNVPESFEDGDWRGVGNDLKLVVKDNSFESFLEAHKENYVPKAEYEKAAKLSREDVLSKFKPEIAAAIELVDLGVPQDLIFEPTKQIDGYLALEDSELVRADLKARDYTDEMIDTKMESMVEAGKVKAEADIIRLELGKQKQQVLNTRTQIVQQKTAERELVQKQLKDREIAQLKEVLNNKSEFMGVPLSKDVKEAIAKKLQSGGYDDDLAKAEAKVDTILYKQFGSKLAEHIKTKAFADGKLSEVKKLSNVPEVKSQTAGSVKVSQEQQESDNAFGALKGVTFGG